MLFVAIANGAYYGGGMRIAPDAALDDGWLDVCIVGDISRLTAIRELPNLYRGTHVRNPAVSVHRARHLEISGEGTTACTWTGSRSARSRCAVEVGPGALEVAVVATDADPLG